MNTNKRKMTLNQRRGWMGVLFLAPWLIGVTLLFLLPMFQSLRFSLSRLELMDHGFVLHFEGIKNYVTALLEHPTYNRLLTEAMIDMVVNVPLIIFFSLFSATLLNQKFFGRGLARAIFFLPVILSSGIIAQLAQNDFLSQMMNVATSSGSQENFTLLKSFELQKLLLESGMHKTLVDYFTNAVNRIYEIVSASGVQILIFLAGLQSISSSLYEAAKIEGATGYEMFWKITFPMISPLILTNVIYSVIDSFTNNAMTKLIFDTAFKSHNFGLSAAMSWMYFLFIIVCLWIIAKLITKKVFYYD